MNKLHLNKRPLWFLYSSTQACITYILKFILSVGMLDQTPSKTKMFTSPILAKPHISFKWIATNSYTLSYTFVICFICLHLTSSIVTAISIVVLKKFSNMAIMLHNRSCHGVKTMFAQFQNLFNVAISL